MSAPGPYFCKFNHLIYPASVSLAEMCTGGISAYPCARRCALDGIWIVVAYTAGYDFAPPLCTVYRLFQFRLQGVDELVVVSQIVA